MPQIVTAETTELVSLAEVKAHLNMSGTSQDDDELDLVRRAAEEQAQAIAGDVLHRVNVERRPVSGRTVVLRRRPILSVESVTAGGGSVAYAADLEAGILTGIGYRGSVEVAYTSGRTECPASIRLATLILAQHLWRTQQGVGPAGYDDDVETAYSTSGTGYAIPSRAEELLRPFSSGPAFA